MSNPIITAAKLNRKRSALELKITELKDVTEREEALLGAIDAAITDEDLETVERSVEDIQNEKTAKENEKAGLEQEIADLEKSLEESNDKAPTQTDELEGGQRQMAKDNVEVREGIKGYIRSKGQERAGFTSVEGGALIPVDLQKPKKEADETIDLSKMVSVVKVNNASGKYPIIKKSGGKMVSVAELALNPELAKPTFADILYDIDTYRGYIPVSQEVIDDADYDVTGLIAEEIADQELNTKNFHIANALKAATPKTITNLDGFKKLFNLDIKKAYSVKAVLSASLYNALDTLKATDGSYLLQSDVTVESGKKLFGKEVVVLDDDVIGTIAGDMVGFVGDAKEAVTLFDRKQASVKWVDNDVYGQLLAGFVRFDVVATDTEAGFYVTYTPGI